MPIHCALINANLLCIDSPVRETAPSSQNQAHIYIHEQPIILKIDDIPGLQVSVLASQHPQSVLDLHTVHLVGFLQQYQTISSSPDQLGRILGLLQEYQSICPHIQLIYPWYDALPSIDLKIDSQIGWSANVQLSHKLADELIEYVNRFIDAGEIVEHTDSRQV